MLVEREAQSGNEETHSSQLTAHSSQSTVHSPLLKFVCLIGCVTIGCILLVVAIGKFSEPLFLKKIYLSPINLVGAVFDLAGWAAVQPNFKDMVRERI